MYTIDKPEGRYTLAFTLVNMILCKNPDTSPSKIVCS